MELPSISSATNAMAGANTSSSGELEARRAALLERLQEQTEPTPERAMSLLSLAQVQIGLEKNAESWAPSREAFDIFMQAGDYEQAADACYAMFLCDQNDSLPALGQGIWLSVTFPVDPAITLGLLQHVVDETADDSDGAAVAAATARYIVDMRAEDKQRENLMFFADQMLGNVAKRHSQVESQQEFSNWMQKLELNEPEKFLVRLRNVVDVLVQDNWWFDRDALQATIPVN